MQITIDPGSYVVAVSGGVDSMVLLDLLSELPDLQLTIVHLDHGIRLDSGLDRELVEKAATKYGLPFVYQEAELGPDTSELKAREARYAFLNEAKEKATAQGIITAHHQDDVLETAMLNMLRGTGRKGLSSLRSSAELIRPLLHVSKQAIRDYATANHIEWREDSTNQDERYLRNFVRGQLLPQLSIAQKQQLTERLITVAELNEELDGLLLSNLAAHMTPEGLDRQWFIDLPYDVSTELMAAWLRWQRIHDFDRKGITRLVVGAKTAVPGKRVEANAGWQLYIGKQYLRLINHHAS